jgi:hypothetical protein
MFESNFPSTKPHTVIRSSGTPASCWQRVRASKKLIYLPGLRRGFIASTQLADGKEFNLNQR